MQTIMKMILIALIVMGLSCPVFAKSHDDEKEREGKPFQKKHLKGKKKNKHKQKRESLKDRMKSMREDHHSKMKKLKEEGKDTRKELKGEHKEKMKEQRAEEKSRAKGMSEKKGGHGAKHLNSRHHHESGKDESDKAGSGVEKEAVHD